MIDSLICLPLSTVGYIWVRTSAIRLVRITNNNQETEPHIIQLNDGLEYEIFGKAKSTLDLLGWNND